MNQDLQGQTAACRSTSPGEKLRAAVVEHRPLPVVGAVNAYAARLATRAGFRALYLSGAGVANAAFALPDLGMTSLNDVLEEVRRITSATDLPLLVDGDTGWGGTLNVARTVRELIRAGAAGVHIEDQVAEKRCGHRPRKAVVPLPEMVARIRAAADGRTDPEFVIMARTDAVAVEGLSAAIERAQACLDAGADMIFPEALASLDEYRAFTTAVSAPVLANITEFGRTPLFTREELGAAGVALVLYPLSAFRAMNQAAWRVYQAIARDGTQQGVVDLMQTRDELYDMLDYYRFEQQLDRLSSPGGEPL